LKSAVAIRHVHFEDLGSFEEVLRSAGFSIRYLDGGAGADDLVTLDALAPDLLIVLGGPIGAYEEAIYRFLRDELRLLEARLAANQPIMGICLGAQLMARALGARVYPASRKELGWAPVSLTGAGKHSALRYLENTPVLHWHGDTFDLPKGATLLASTEVCENQAFSFGDRAVGLQFHPEAIAQKLEEWFIGHACEIASTPGVSVNQLRQQSATYAGALQSRATEFFSDWLSDAER
jgi:GMP synthase (glutamine-hydrolysing)